MGSTTHTKRLTGDQLSFRAQRARIYGVVPLDFMMTLIQVLEGNYIGDGCGSR